MRTNEKQLQIQVETKKNITLDDLFNENNINILEPEIKNQIHRIENKFKQIPSEQRYKVQFTSSNFTNYKYSTKYQNIIKKIESIFDNVNMLSNISYIIKIEYINSILAMVKKWDSNNLIYKNILDQFLLHDRYEPSDNNHLWQDYIENSAIWKKCKIAMYNNKNKNTNILIIIKYLKDIYDDIEKNYPNPLIFHTDSSIDNMDYGDNLRESLSRQETKLNKLDINYRTNHEINNLDSVTFTEESQSDQFNLENSISLPKVTKSINNPLDVTHNEISIYKNPIIKLNDLLNNKHYIHVIKPQDIDSISLNNLNKHVIAKSGLESYRYRHYIKKIDAIFDTLDIKDEITNKLQIIYNNLIISTIKKWENNSPIYKNIFDICIMEKNISDNNSSNFWSNYIKNSKKWNQCKDAINNNENEITNILIIFKYINDIYNEIENINKPISTTFGKRNNISKLRYIKTFVQENINTPNTFEKRNNSSKLKYIKPFIEEDSKIENDIDNKIPSISSPRSGDDLTDMTDVINELCEHKEIKENIHRPLDVISEKTSENINTNRSVTPSLCIIKKQNNINQPNGMELEDILTDMKIKHSDSKLRPYTQQNIYHSSIDDYSESILDVSYDNEHSNMEKYKTLEVQNMKSVKKRNINKTTSTMNKYKKDSLRSNVNRDPSSIAKYRTRQLHSINSLSKESPSNIVDESDIIKNLDTIKKKKHNIKRTYLSTIKNKYLSTSKSEKKLSNNISHCDIGKKYINYKTLSPTKKHRRNNTLLPCSGKLQKIHRRNKTNLFSACKPKNIYGNLKINTSSPKTTTCFTSNYGSTRSTSSAHSLNLRLRNNNKKIAKQFKKHIIGNKSRAIEKYKKNFYNKKKYNSLKKKTDVVNLAEVYDNKNLSPKNINVDISNIHNINMNQNTSINSSHTYVNLLLDLSINSKNNEQD